MIRAAGRWALTFALSAGSVGAAMLALSATATESDGRSVQGTPVLNARRAPNAVAEAVAVRDLRRDLDGVFSDPAFGPRSQRCLIVERGDRVLYRQQPSAVLIPASNQKVLTAAAALAELGPQSRFTTEVRAPSTGPFLDGPLYLVGGGDPLLGTESGTAARNDPLRPVTRLETLAEAVVAAGVREIKGPVVGVGARYDSERYIASWKESYALSGVIGPMGGLVVDGGFEALLPTPKPASDPALHAAELLRQQLAARGVAVAGSAAGVAPEEPLVTVASVASVPLLDVVAHMLRASDNLAAELLVKEMGLRGRSQGSTTAGLDEAADALRAAGLALDEAKLVDGSGLDRGNRATCDLILRTFEPGGPDGPIARGFAVAGESGTLADRFLQSPARKRLRAKTGALAGVAALSGFVLSERGPLEFALLANGLPDAQHSGQELQRRLGEALASYPKGPSAAEIGPRV